MGKHPHYLAPWQRQLHDDQYGAQLSAPCAETGKVIFRQRDHARKHCAGKGGRRVRVYRCRHCWGWHVTTTAKMPNDGRKLGDLGEL